MNFFESSFQPIIQVTKKKSFAKVMSRKHVGSAKIDLSCLICYTVTIKNKGNQKGLKKPNLTIAGDDDNLTVFG